MEGAPGDEVVRALAPMLSTPARALVGAICGLVVVLSFGSATSAAQARGVARGIVDSRLESAYDVDLRQVPAWTQQLGAEGLGAAWTRVLVHWSKIQPGRPGALSQGDEDHDGYADAYVDELDTVVHALSAQHIKVIMTITEVPKWASNSALWAHPPSASFEHGYSPIYAINADDPKVLGQYARLGAWLAGRYGASAAYFECWNEPNLGGSFYPQSRKGDRRFGLRIYLKMLRAFHAAVKSANPRAVVIAGATSPRGDDDDFSTRPATFARYLKDHHADRYFEGYSCHIYSWGPPNRPPPQPQSAVTLGNLDSLIKYFPKKDFFVTEFGYCTADPSRLGQVVSEADQARYLRQAYSFTKRRYKRVKTILWFMVRDLESIAGGPGISMGLKRVDGSLKPGWFAFAGGNRMSAVAPASVRRMRRFEVSGALATSLPGATPRVRVRLEWRHPKDRRWRRSSTALARPDGSYGFRVRQGRGVRYYRAVWDGVCESKKAIVRAY